MTYQVPTELMDRLREDLPSEVLRDIQTYLTQNDFLNVELALAQTQDEKDEAIMTARSTAGYSRQTYLSLLEASSPERRNAILVDRLGRIARLVGRSTGEDRLHWLSIFRKTPVSVIRSMTAALQTDTGIMDYAMYVLLAVNYVRDPKLSGEQIAALLDLADLVDARQSERFQEPNYHSSRTRLLQYAE